MSHRQHVYVFLITSMALMGGDSFAQSSGWISLSSADAWRGYLKADLPAGWQFVDGALTRVGAGGDIITRQQFDNFELEIEWKVAPGGNSGIFFRVQEDTSLATVYYSGPEFQILDNRQHHDGLDPRTTAGSNYALHAPVRDATKKAGEWNLTRLVVNDSHVEHWLNGVKLLEYELWTDKWKQLVAASKFKEWPVYGMARKGHIALQDHGDRVAYRNIRIRNIRIRTIK